jgi:hypothetical protein
VLVCDRDVPLHEVSLAALAAARGSTFKPFPPRHRSWAFDFAAQRPPTPAEVDAAIEEAATGMLRPPIANLGVRGIRKAAHVVPRWPDALDAAAVRDACRDAFVMIDATGGTGGGLFRYMYARFLDEAAGVTGDGTLRDVARRLTEAGDRWQDAAASSTGRPAAAIPPCTWPRPRPHSRPPPTSRRTPGRLCCSAAPQ